MMQQLLDTVRYAWGFTGLVPTRVLDVNPFGNLLVEDVGGRIWWICPEDSGDIAGQIKDLPDGAKVRFRIVD